MKSKIREEAVHIGPVRLQVQVCGEPDKPALLLLHSLSGNASIFNGLLNNGLAKDFRLIIPDLRGRGDSDRPPLGYSLEEQVADLVAILDHFAIETVSLCGHSFGGYLAACFASAHPERVERLTLLDTAIQLNPLTPQLILLPLTRLFQSFPDWQTYLEVFRSAPFIDKWHDDMLPFVRHDMKEVDGRLVPRASWHSVLQATLHVMAKTHQDWRRCFSSISCPLLLLQASDPFAFGQHIVEDGPAYETLALVYSAQHKHIPGNHLTMLFGEGARMIVSALKAFSLPREAARSRVLGIF